MLQHVTDALRDAVTFPLVDDGRRIKRLLVGSVLVATSFLLVPLVLLGGYYVRYLRASVHDDPEPPRFDEWGTLFVDGLKLFGLGIAFAAVVLAFAVGGTLVGQVGVFAVETLGAVGGLVSAVLALLVLGAFVLFLATFPAMVSNFAVEGRLKAALDTDRISAVVTTPVYLVLLFFAFFANQIGLVFGGMLAVVLVGFPLAFYAQLVAVGLIGRGYAHGTGIPEPDTDDDPTGAGPVSTGVDGEPTEGAEPTETTTSDAVGTERPTSPTSAGTGSSDTPSAERRADESTDGSR